MGQWQTGSLTEMASYSRLQINEEKHREYPVSSMHGSINNNCNGGVHRDCEYTALVAE